MAQKSAREIAAPWDAFREKVMSLSTEASPGLAPADLAELRRVVSTATAFPIWHVWLISIAPAVLIWITSEKGLGLIRWGAIPYLLSVVCIFAGYAAQNHVRGKAKARARALAERANLVAPLE